MTEYIVPEFRYQPLNKLHIEQSKRSTAVPGAGLSTSDVCISILPPGQVDAHFVAGSAFIDVNLAASETSFALNSDKTISSVIQPNSFGFVTKGTDFKIISQNQVPCVLVEIGDDVFTHWMESADIDPSSLEPFRDYRHDPAVGSFGQLATTLLNEMSLTGGPADVMTMEAIVLGMSARLMGSLSKQENDGMSSIHRLLSNKDHRLERSVEFTMAHLSNPALKIADLAAEANMSVQHYSDIFKQWKGVSPYAFIRSERLKLASHLLKATKMPIATIAYETGFSSQAHLTTAFKTIYGVTPGSLRR